MESTMRLLEWKAAGRAEGFAEGLAAGLIEARREDLLKLLQVKFHHLPSELSAAIRTGTDLDRLSRWFEAGLSATTLEAFGLLIREW